MASNSAAESHLRTGRRVFALGLIGLLLSVAVGVAGWALVDGAVDSIDATLEITDEALSATSDTIEVANETITVTADGIAAIRTVTVEVRDALAATADVMSDADTVLASSVPDSLDAVRVPLPALASTMEAITEIFDSLSFLGIDFDPRPDPAESLRAIDQELAALAEDLRDPDLSLTVVGASLDEVARELGDTDGPLILMGESLEEARDLIDRYDETTTRASDLVDDASTDLGERRVLARGLVVLIAAVLAVVSLGSIMIGRQAIAFGLHLLEEPGPDEG